jgi:DNA-directed RNA polymerase specialized sigma24 family protein
MLEELAKRDKDWRKMAFHICKSHDTADDIVQDMYLKFANYDKKVNDFYIYFAIKSIWLDKLKDKKTKTVELIDNCNTFADTYDFELDEIKEITLKKVKQLPFFERELLKVTTQEMSQRELSRQTGINLLVIQKTVKKTKEQLWEDVKKLQEREI